jgi:hypothetical protein
MTDTVTSQNIGPFLLGHLVCNELVYVKFHTLLARPLLWMFSALCNNVLITSITFVDISMCFGPTVEAKACVACLFHLGSRYSFVALPLWVSVGDAAVGMCWVLRSLRDARERNGG